MAVIDNKKPYNLARISDRDGDLSKRWYVDFYVWDIFKQEKVRKFDYEINSLKRDPKLKANPDALRKAMWKRAYEIKAVIDKKLKRGYCIDSTPRSEDVFEPEELTAETALIRAIPIFFNRKKIDTDSEKTEAAYRTHINLTGAWLKTTNYSLIPLKLINYNIGRSYMDWYQKRINPKTGESVSNSSYNRQLIHWKCFFNHLVDTEIITRNPIRSIKQLPEIKTQNVPYQDHQVKPIMDRLQSEDPQLALICKVMYYCFIRRNELRFARIRDIEGNKWRIPGKIFYDGRTRKVSKNGKNQVVIIPDALKELLEKSGVLDYPGDYFIFGRNGIPSEKATGRDNFTTRYKRTILDFFKLNKGESLYSWKHTGVCKLYRKFKDVEMIRKHCRHSIITTTMIYLRDLGLFEDNELEEGFPTL